MEMYTANISENPTKEHYARRRGFENVEHAEINIFL